MLSVQTINTPAPLSTSASGVVQIQDPRVSLATRARAPTVGSRERRRGIGDDPTHPLLFTRLPSVIGNRSETENRFNIQRSDPTRGVEL